MAEQLAVLPDRQIPSAAFPVALRKLSGVFDQPPSPDHVASVVLGPVVKDHLIEHETSVFVVEMVHFDQIDRLAGHVLLGRDPEGNNTSAEGENKGTHQPPPCCR